MPDKDDKPRSNKLPANLAAWAESGEPNESRTVIFRIAPNADTDSVCDKLGKLQVTVTSSGPAVIVGTVNRLNLLRVADLDEVVRIDASRRLAPKADENTADLLSPKHGKRFRLPRD